jgi:uncharacterized membrane protein YdjX (TVP38/TMEM64 family)
VSLIKRIKEKAPLAIIIIALGCFFYFGGYKYISLRALQAHHQTLATWTQHHFWLSVLTAFAIYAVGTGISIPAMAIITIAIGFLFGPALGTVIVVCGATCGASIVFLATRSAFTEAMEKKAGKFMKKFEAGFQKNSTHYMLFLRLVPLFPFTLVNIVPALLGVRWWTFAWTTFIGIIPGSFVYVLVGHGFEHILSQGSSPNMGIIFQPRILAPIVGLGLLSLVPILYKKIRKSN